MLYSNLKISTWYPHAQAIERDFIAWKDVTHDYKAMAAFLHSSNSSSESSSNF